MHRKDLLFRALLAFPVCLLLTGRAEAQAWLSQQWQYRMSITAQENLIEGNGTLSNFPLLLQLDAAHHAAIFNDAKSDGSDLRFTLGDGTTPLAYELVSYSSASQTAQIWVRMSALSKTQNELFLYYGNPSATSASSSAVWANYEAVYHYEQNPAGGSLSDSSPNQHTATPRVLGAETWTVSDRVSGQIGSAWQYDTDKTVNNQSIVMAETSWTISAWVNVDEHGTDMLVQGGPCFFFLAPSASDISWDIQYKNDYCPTTGIDYRFRRGMTQPGSWHHYAWSMDAATSTVTVYHDGTPNQSSWTWPIGGQVVPHGIGNGSEPLGIGSTMFPQHEGDSMNGKVDELRIRPGASSAEWMLTEYRNQASPADMYFFGPVQERVALPSRSVGDLKSRF